MARFYCLLFIFICLAGQGTRAQDSSHLRISLLTCTPGDELYSIFGHSAIRITDSSSVTDIVYNYGTFNFDDEGFYIKFIRGKLPYYLSIVDFPDFQWDYQATNRGMSEQILNLSPAEKTIFQHRLNENLKEENKYYQYDFFLDNCTTRLRDAIIQISQPAPQLPAVMPVSTTFREAIHQYLDAGKQPWSKLGIDILLGAPTDAIMTPAQQQFLPDNLMAALDKSSNKKMVESKKNLYPFTPFHEVNIITPFLFCTGLLLLFIVLQLFTSSPSSRLMQGMDGMLFFFTGLLGILLIFMWTGTDHSMTKDNYNLLWAWPTHIIAAFLIIKNNRALKIYFTIASVFLTLVLLAWFFLPQQLNPALIPFNLLLLYRMATRLFTYEN
ncbi:MAG: DUF4105 domain-containing protein [Ferruginibacter sp.]